MIAIRVEITRAMLKKWEEADGISPPTPSGPCQGALHLDPAAACKQFRALCRKKDADALALHLLALSQGLAAAVNCFLNDTLVRREVEALRDWLDARVLEMP